MLDRRKLQVFVSSTYVDLIDERQFAVSAILKSGHIPAGMELFTAGDKSQLDVIKRWIDHSDVYMLILGTRYGSLEPDSKIGYTELEFDHAVSSGKPFFSIVMNDDAVDKKYRETGAKFVEKDNPEKLKLFRDKVMSRMCSLYSEPKEIRGLVYENLMEFIDRQDLEGWVRGGLAANSAVLYDQISNLTLTNERLQAEVSELRLSRAGRKSHAAEDKEFDALRSVLEKSIVTIPKSISKTGKAHDTDAFSMLVTNRNFYISGVTVSASSGERSLWFESNLYPIFITHKLLVLERRSTNARFYVASERAHEFLAWVDMLSLKNSKD